MPAIATRPRSAFRKSSGPSGERSLDAKPKAASTEEHEILFQQFFKSVGPRTYVSQVKKANNGNHYVVLTEGRRDEKTDEVRKARVFLYSEDFVEFFKLIKATAEFVKAHPVSEEVKRKRDQFWAKQREGEKRQGDGQTRGQGEAGASLKPVARQADFPSSKIDVGRTPPKAIG